MSKFAKYLNSSNSKIFDKSTTLYWLDKQAIKKNGFVILVEWYMDVIALKKIWLKNVVATLWTSLNQFHLMILSLYTERLLLCFDNDNAWKVATERAIELLGLFEYKVFEYEVFDMFWYKDPDEFISNNKEYFLQLIKK